MQTTRNVERYRNRIVSLLNEDELNSAFLVEEIDRVNTPKLRRTFCSNCLELFVHLRFDEETAKRHWDGIFANHRNLCSSLSRQVGLRLAVFDYFLNLNRCLDNPILVEIRLFRNTEQQAMVDGLTGLYNRRYFDDCIRKEINRCMRHDSRMSVLIVDIDNLKKINDGKGHLFGDQAIRHVALSLQASLRKEDVPCRYGGDEFVVVMPETTENGAMALAMRFRDKLNRDSLARKQGLTVSGGIATYPFDGNTPETLLSRADKGLYKAKFMGKNTVVRDSARAARRRRFRRNWRIAIQPIHDTFSRKPLRTFYTQDVSVGGIKFQANAEYRLNTKMLMRVVLPDREGMFVVGNVVWCKQLPQREYSYGVEFYDLNSEQLSKLKQVLPSNYNVPEL